MPVVQEDTSFKVFFSSLFSSGGHFILEEQKDFSNFGRGSPKEHFFEIIRNQSIDPGGDVI